MMASQGKPQPSLPRIDESKLTSSTTGVLYFAYGSNISPSQMSLRCTYSPAQSARPIAIARLDGWDWFICTRGYANIRETPTTNPKDTFETTLSPKFSSTNSTMGQTPDLLQYQHVYGVIYNMDPSDVTILDSYEGCGPLKDPNPTPNPSPDPAIRRRTPHLQLSNRDYNKHYIPMTITKWLVPDPASTLGLDPQTPGLHLNLDYQSDHYYHHHHPCKLTILVYIDEQRLQDGEIVESYIGRMNRAIREGAKLGVPMEWMERVMRRWVKNGVELVDESFIGDVEGYVEGGGIEAREGLVRNG